MGRRKREPLEVATGNLENEAIISEATGGDPLELVNAVLDRLNTGKGRKFGTLRGSGAVEEKVMGVIPSGSLSLDLALGVGGWPRGRIIEIYGAEASGKTTLALQTIAEAQKMGLAAGFVDAEHALDPSYAEALGVDTESLVFVQPDSGEAALQDAEAMIRAGVKVVVVDSVAALTPQVELDGEIGDVTVGAQARLLSQACRKLVGLVNTSDALLIFINQERMKIGVKFGSPKTTSGGNALKFYASVRVEVTRIGSLKRNDVPYGNKVKMHTKKNKVSPPYRSVEVDLIFGEGFSREGEVLDRGIKLGLIRKSGAWFYLGEQGLGQGRDAVIERLKTDKGTFDQLAAEILAKDTADFGGGGDD